MGHYIGLSIVRKPELSCLGITNETDDTYFTPFFDWDDVELKVVYRDLQHVAKVFNLCTFVIVCSSEKEYTDPYQTKKIGSYHAIGIDKMTYREHREMTGHTRCDKFYRRPSNSMKSWVLRISAKYDNGTKKPFTVKPHLVDVLCFNTKCKKQHSLAHMEFLRKYYKAKIPITNSDKLKNLEYIEYSTGKK